MESPLVPHAVTRCHCSHSTCLHHLGLVFSLGLIFVFFFVLMAGTGLYVFRMRMAKNSIGWMGLVFVSEGFGKDWICFLVYCLLFVWIMDWFLALLYSCDFFLIPFRCGITCSAAHVYVRFFRFVSQILSGCSIVHCPSFVTMFGRGPKKGENIKKKVCGIFFFSWVWLHFGFLVIFGWILGIFFFSQRFDTCVSLCSHLCFMLICMYIFLVGIFVFYRRPISMI